jgi:uncharacterized protein YdaU (DUF1376 family)
VSSRTLPWYAWYPTDFMGAVRGWSILERGAYRDALDAQWTLDGLPADPDDVRKIIGATPAEFRRIWSRIEAKFPVATDGLRRNLRLERERSRGNRVSEVRAELGRLGAAKRWAGRSHSNSHAGPDGNSHELANGKTMPSTSTSTTRKDPDSETDPSRKRARPATPDGARARHDVMDESDPEVQRRRREAAELATAAAKTTEPAQ